MSNPILCWFRRDFRLTDHLALSAAAQSGKPIIPVFIFDPAILRSDRLSAARLDFMLRALTALDDSLQRYRTRLLVLHGEPLAVLRDLITATGADDLVFNEDYTPYAQKRDSRIMDALDIRIETFHDRLLMPPGSVMNDDSKPYTVYTPFKKKWRSLKSERLPIREMALESATFYPLDGLENRGIPSLADLGFASNVTLPTATEAEARRRLEAWLADGIADYADKRDFLGNPQTDPLTQTSFLSPYIRFGLISLRTIYWRCVEAYQQADLEAHRASIEKYVDELIWHEFYTHILHIFPQVKTRNFNPKYDAVTWRDAPDDLQAWKDGRTGYPVVDAAMRQLKATGWMHNRARMITASFLSKDLLIDWREGERYFMQHLIDGDLAANNGGWQWAAGTGTDAQPYFRIFNPVSQSQKFDPDGAFIRAWIPELRDVADAFIHEPHQSPKPPQGYPAPRIDHAIARQAALAAYQVIKEENR